MNDYTAEIYRKSIHLSSLWIPITYYFLSTKTMFTIIGCITFMALLIELSRKTSSELNKLIGSFIGDVMRDKEKEGLAGATYMLLGSSLCILLFSKEIAIFALTVLVISDACAALIGKKYGKHSLLDKTIEGTASFYGSAIIIYLTLKFLYGFNLPFWGANIAIIFGTGAELFSKRLKVDDNLAIPVIICSVLSLF